MVMKRVNISWLLLVALVLYMVGAFIIGGTDTIRTVLKYQDIYYSAPFFSFFTLVVAEIFFKGEDEYRYMIYGECIIGCLLLLITTKDKIIPTVIYWTCVAIICYCHKKVEDDRKRTT